MAGSVEVDVAIVGGGPAGLAAATALRRAGVERVVIFDREAEAGGVPRHCAHPPFGMREFGRVMTGPEYARRLVRRAGDAGVDIRTSSSVVRMGDGGRLDVATSNGPLGVRAHRIVIATGARETPRSTRLIGGDRPVGVINTGALQSYVYLARKMPFLRPVIVGTELVSLSAIWTCLAHGIRPVAVIEPGSRATARWPLALFPRLLGIPVFYDTQLTSIIGVGRVTQAMATGANGAQRIIDCDGILLTGMFVPEASLTQSSGIPLDAATHGPAIDQFGRCGKPNYFAAGNVLRGIETAGWCYREGTRIGEFVARSLREPLGEPKLSIPVHPGDAVKYVVPQRLTMDDGLASAADMQVRLSRPARGRLVLTVRDQVVWSRHIDSRQERRILIPLQRLDPSRLDGAVTVSIQGK